jgi:uncharacterized protein (DUF1501 family)
MHSAMRNISGGADGWGARLTSQMSSAFGGVSLSGSNLFVKGGTNPPRVISDLSSFGESRIFWDDSESMFLRDIRTANLLDGEAPRNEAEQYSLDSIVRLQGNIESLKQLGQLQLPVTFPNTGLGQRLEDAARLIAAGPTLNTQVIYTDIGGFDTHSDEKPRLTQLLQEVNGAVTAFVACMKSLNRWNDVVIATMTEFTRTMENNSKGTDHGAAGPMLVLGGALKGGQRGPAPTDSDVANYEYIQGKHFNFTQVYGELVGWMGFDPNLIFTSPDLAPSPYLGMF